MRVAFPWRLKRGWSSRINRISRISASNALAHTRWSIVASSREQLRNLATIVRREVRAHPGAQVRGLAHVQHSAITIAEDVHTGLAGQPGRERELRGRRMGAHLRQCQQVVETEHAVARGPLEQRVQHLRRRGRVGIRAVIRFHARAEMARERVQLQVRDLVAHKSAGQRERVDAAVGQAWIAVRDQRGVEKRAIEANVVTDDHRVAREIPAAAGALRRCAAPAAPSIR